MIIKLTDTREPIINMLIGTRKYECLLDTGFTGLLIGYIYSSNENLHLNSLSLTEKPQLLSEKQWVTVANGSKARTWISKVFISFDKTNQLIDIMIIEAKERQTPDFIIGIEFLEQFNCCLFMDFKNRVFELSMQ